MPPREPIPRRFLLGVLLLACALLMDEILLTRIFSVIAAHHFAFMVVSVAMFATGLASMRLFLARARFAPEQAGRNLNRYATGFAVSVLVSTLVLVHLPINLDISLGALAIVAGLYLLVGVPIYLGGFALSLAFYHWAGQLGTVYAWDLVGASLGCGLTLLGLEWLKAGGAIVAVAALGLVSAALFLDASVSAAARRTTWTLLAVTLGLLAVESHVGLFEVRYVLGKWPGPPSYVHWNSISRIAVYPQEGAHRIVIDAAAATEALQFDGHKVTPSIENFQARASSLPFGMRTWENVLVIGAGGGEDVLMALLAGARHVTGVEINPATVAYVRNQAADFTGRLFSHPQVTIVNDDARSFVQRTSERFDLIQMSLIDTFAATGAGAFTLTENSLYTQEAFDQYFAHLAPDGVLNISRWNNEVLRVLTLGCTGMRKLGLTDLTRHIVILSGGGLREFNPRLFTVLFKRSPFTAAEIGYLKDRASRSNATLYYSWTGVRDPNLATIIEAPDLEPVYASSVNELRPPSDDRPFFFYTLKPSNLWPPNPRVLRDTLSPSNAGLYLLACVVVVAGVALVSLIAWPMRALLPELPDRTLALRLGAYFALTGLGFMLLEVGLLQKFSLFLGSPALSLSVILASLLLASGLGSWTTTRVPQARGAVHVLLTTVCLTAGIAFFTLVGPRLLSSWLEYPRTVRVLLSLTLVFPLGFLMGRCLPLGVRTFEPLSASLMPWLWGMNTIFSVAGAILATLVSMNLGFSADQWLALLCYASLPLCVRGQSSLRS